MSYAMNRRKFLLGAAPAGLTAAALANRALAQAAKGAAVPVAAAAPATERTVFLAGDAAPVTPLQGLATLTAALSRNPTAADNYLKGGAVTELEQTFAAMLGKEDCVYLPTGTLANNLAVRILCGEHKHVIVQADSHLYADESDSASIMSGLTMDAIAAGKAAPTCDEFAAAIDFAEHRAYPIKVGAISIESPVRRHNGESVPYATIEKVCELAKSKGIGTHWDGARALMLTGTPGFDLKRTAAPFDTVFVSLYKALHAPFGAVLAGPKPMIAQARDLRHVYGGLIYHGWSSAVPALEALPGFAGRFTQARVAAEALLAKLQAGGYTVTRVPNESNIVLLQVPAAHAAGLQDRLAAADIRARVGKDATMQFFINETILHRSTAELASAFLAT